LKNEKCKLDFEINTVLSRFIDGPSYTLPLQTLEHKNK